jgi:hypothetical protein
LTNFHKIDIFQPTISNHQGGGADISSLSGKRLVSEGNLREI